MTEQTPATVTDIRAASTARWLARALEPAREEIAETPTAEAVERIRARVFGEGAARKRQRTLAA